MEGFPERAVSVSLNVSCKCIKRSVVGLHVRLRSVDLPAEMRIIDSSMLSNLTVGNNSLGEFECRTSVSNPQAVLTIVRQSNDGVKHADIQYKSASTYINGVNSVKFTVTTTPSSLVYIVSSSISSLAAFDRSGAAWKSVNMRGDLGRR